MKKWYRLVAATALAATIFGSGLTATPAAALAASGCSGWHAGNYYYLHCTYDDGMHRLFVSGNGSIRSYAWYE